MATEKLPIMEPDLDLETLEIRSQKAETKIGAYNKKDTFELWKSTRRCFFRVVGNIDTHNDAINVFSSGL